MHKLIVGSLRCCSEAVVIVDSFNAALPGDRDVAGLIPKINSDDRHDEDEDV